VLKDRGIIAIGFINNDKIDTFVMLNLTTGAHLGITRSVIEEKQSEDRQIVAVGEIYGTDQLYMVSSDNINPGIIWIFDISENEFVKSYSTGYQATVVVSHLAFFMVANYNDDKKAPQLIKFPYESSFLFGTIFIAKDIDMKTPTSFPVSSGDIERSDETNYRSLSSNTYSEVANTYEVIEYFQTPFNYLDGSYQTVYVPAGGKNTVNISSPCLADSSGTLTGSLVNNQNEESSPSWITLSEDLSSIVADAPEIVNGSDKFYFGVQFKYLSYEYTQYSTIQLFDCGILNCAN
jgi:hypothetical protein